MMIKLKTLLVEQEQENKYPADAPKHFGGGENIDILGYQTKHFDICKSAVTLYEKLKEYDDEKVKVILVNIFAGINRCDWVAEGIVEALKKIEVNVPLVIRLAGTNVEKGNQILKESKINYIEANTLEDAANKAVAALNK